MCSAVYKAVNTKPKQMVNNGNSSFHCKCLAYWPRAANKKNCQFLHLLTFKPELNYFALFILLNQPNYGQCKTIYAAAWQYAQGQAY